VHRYSLDVEEVAQCLMHGFAGEAFRRFRERHFNIRILMASKLERALVEQIKLIGVDGKWKPIHE
jgi:hypothetical protein